MHEWYDPLPQDHRFRTIRVNDYGAVEIHGLLYMSQRQSVSLVADPRQQRRQDRQRRRKAKRERRTPAQLALNLQRPAERLELGRDHIKADSSTRHLRDLPGSREPGPGKYPCQQVVGQNIYLGIRQPLLLGNLQDLIPVDPPTVVAYTNDDRRTLPRRGKLNAPLGRLAGTFPHLRLFYPMINRVPQQVHQWVAYFVEDRPVEFNLLAIDMEGNAFLELPSYVTNQTRESVEYLPHRRHARIDDFVL